MITDEYVRQLKSVHQRETWGASGYSHASIVNQWRVATGSDTVLDYGCGTGTLKTALLQLKPSLEVREYDPGIPGKDQLPMPADLLVVTDVLEHIEPQYVDRTLTYLRLLAKKGAYFTIALTPSKVTLPDGRNAHLTLLPANEWTRRLTAAGFTISKAQMRKGLWVWAT